MSSEGEQELKWDSIFDSAIPLMPDVPLRWQAPPVSFFLNNLVSAGVLLRNTTGWSIMGNYYRRGASGDVIFEQGRAVLDWALIQLALHPLDPRAGEEHRKAQYATALRGLRIARTLPPPGHTPRVRHRSRDQLNELHGVVRRLEARLAEMEERLTRAGL